MSITDKQLIGEHGHKLKIWSIVGSIRAAVRRSLAIIELQKRGTIFLQSKKDSSMLEVPENWWD